MHPTLHEGDLVIGWTRRLQVGSVVVATHGDREIVKRIERIDNDAVYVVGDNSAESTDSRHYGNLKRSAILGTIMIVLPKAIAPPKVVKPYAVILGRLVAVVLVAMAVIHLFRIDTFIPILDAALPGGSGVASFIALLIILSEVFAVPFALRMQLSPLAHVVSGALVAFAPLWWLLLSIWALDFSSDIGELGGFYSAPGSIEVVAINTLWVALGYYALYMLGYGQLTMRTLRAHKKKLIIN